MTIDYTRYGEIKARFRAYERLSEEDFKFMRWVENHKRAASSASGRRCMARFKDHKTVGGYGARMT